MLNSPYTVTVKISDGMDSPEYTFKITIKEALPYFVSPLIDQSVKLGEIKTYAPSIINPSSNDASGV